MLYIVLLAVLTMLIYIITKISEISNELSNTKKELFQKLEDTSARKFFILKEFYPSLYKFDDQNKFKYIYEIEEYENLRLADYHKNSEDFVNDYFIDAIKNFYKGNKLKQQQIVKNYSKYANIILSKLTEKGKEVQISSGEKEFLYFKLQHGFLWKGRVAGSTERPFEKEGFDHSLIEHDPDDTFEKYIDREIYKLLNNFTKSSS